jgi:uncharacterized membrane protein YraQ (UPF0718 family)
MERKRRRAAPGGWLFLLSVLVAYGVTGAIDAGAATQALSFFVKAMQNVLPALAIVFLLLLAADLLFAPKWIKGNLGREAGITAWVIAAVGGVLAAGPVYAWYALLRELREKGMRASLAAVFLYTRAVKLPLLPLMIHYFGTLYSVLLCLYLFGFAIVNGLLLLKLEDRVALRSIH